MAGRPRTRAKLEALERFRNGEEPQRGDEQFLTPDNRMRSITRTPEQFNAAGSIGFAEWVMTLTPDMQELLEQMVEEPENAEFSHQTVQRMAMQGASDKDIATLLGMEKKDLVAQAKTALELGRTIYRFLLTHRQFGAGMAGDRTLLVWLGKQKLGQMDRVATEISGPGGNPIEVMEGAKRTRAKLDRILQDSGLAVPAKPAMEEIIAPAWKTLPAAAVTRDEESNGTDG
jgi:hypothetical protein